MSNNKIPEMVQCAICEDIFPSIELSRCDNCFDRFLNTLQHSNWKKAKCYNMAYPLQRKEVFLCSRCKEECLECKTTYCTEIIYTADCDHRVCPDCLRLLADRGYCLSCFFKREADYPKDERGGDPRKYPYKGDHNTHRNELLLHYVSEGDLIMVKRLIDDGADIHHLNDASLHEAVNNNYLEMVKYLIDEGADVSAGSLSLSSARNDFDMVRFLLDHGADIHADQDNGLRRSVDNGHFEMVRFLLDHGADIHACHDNALQMSAEKGDLEMVKLLLERGADIHADHDNALRRSSAKGHLKIVQFLVDKGANVNEYGPTMNSKYIEQERHTALSQSAANGRVEIVKHLLDHGADVHAENDFALRRSAYLGCFEVVRLLLNNGANVHSRDDGYSQKTALDESAVRGHQEIVKLLLDHGADATQLEKRTLLNCAKFCQIKIIKLLLDHGADIHQNNDGALRESARHGNLGIVKLLISQGTDVNALERGQSGHTALNHAIYNRHLKVTEYLLTHGADLRQFPVDDLRRYILSLCPIFLSNWDQFLKYSTIILENLKDRNMLMKFLHQLELDTPSDKRDDLISNIHQKTKISISK